MLKNLTNIRKNGKYELSMIIPVNLKCLKPRVKLLFGDGYSTAS